MPAVSNTSPISNLAAIERLNLLVEQFGTVWIPPAVESELRNIPWPSARKQIEEAGRAGWLQTRPTSNAALTSLLSIELDRGEAEAIALALELKPDWLLIDERDGRAMARQLGVPMTGVVGILLRAKKLGRIKAVKSEIHALRMRAGFFIDSRLESDVLKNAGE